MATPSVRPTNLDVYFVAAALCGSCSLPLLPQRSCIMSCVSLSLAFIVFLFLEYSVYGPGEVNSNFNLWRESRCQKKKRHCCVMSPVVCWVPRDRPEHRQSCLSYTCTTLALTLTFDTLTLNGNGVASLHGTSGGVRTVMVSERTWSMFERVLFCRVEERSIVVVLHCRWPVVRYRTLFRLSGRGTEIVLHLKEDAGEFLSESSLKELIHRYSEFITFPIYQLVEKEEEVEVEDDEEEVEDEDAGEDLLYLAKAGHVHDACA